MQELRDLPKELQEKRQLAYLFKEFDDMNLPRQVLDSVTDDEVAEQVIEFFKGGSALIYPAKSYFVAVTYAYCMCKYFPNYFENISDPLRCYDLLDKDDFYKPYVKSSRKIYKKVVGWIKENNIDVLGLESTQKTINYFREEFLITEDELAGKR